MGFIDFTNGEVLTADQMDLVMRQGIMRFADASARDTALSAVLTEGMMAYLDDTDEVLKYDGTDWIDISGDITGVTAGTALTGGGTSGNVTLDVDLTEVQPNVITTEGDLVIGDASGNPVRLAIGSADQVLTSDGTTMTWEDAGGGGGWTQITTGTLSSTSTTFSSLPADYQDLKIIVDDIRVSQATPISFRISSGGTLRSYSMAFVFLAEAFQAGGTNTALGANYAIGTGLGQSITIILRNYSLQTHTAIHWEGYLTLAGSTVGIIAGGATDFEGAIDEVEFLASENLSGDVQIYGM